MKVPEITIEEIGIIKEAQLGSIQAFNNIFYKYKSFVDNLLYKYIKDLDEAKDLTNIVFLKVYYKLSKFTDYSSFGGWLRILTKNTAIDYLRTIKKNKNLKSLNDSFYNVENIKDNEESFINKITYEEIINKFSNLSEIQKQICKMYYINNLTIKQISDKLNIPNGTIKSHLYRVRKILKTQLKLC